MPAKRIVPGVGDRTVLGCLAASLTSLPSVASKRRAQVFAAGFATATSPKPPRHSIRCGTGLPSCVTSVETCDW